MYDSGDYTVEQIAKAFKTTRPTIYRALDPESIGTKPGVWRCGKPSRQPSPPSSQMWRLVTRSYQYPDTPDAVWQMWVGPASVDRGVPMVRV